MHEANLKQGKLLLLSQHDSVNGRKAISATLGKQPITVGYIASQPDPDRRFYKQTQALYQSIGYDMSVYLELESGFDNASLNQLLTLDAIHLSGGDTFRFLSSIKHRNLEPLLISYFQKGGILIGVSAGAMIMTPSINTATLCGDTCNDVDADWSGLSLVDFTVIPHVEDKFTLFEQGAVPRNCYLLSDEDALLFYGNELYEFGQPLKKQTHL